MLRFLQIAIGLIVTVSCVANEEMIDRVKIYYVPVGVQTYVPITKENIETSYVREGLVSPTNRKFIRLLDTISEAEPGDFIDNMLRVKIVFPDKKITYIDNYGGVNSVGSYDLKLKASNLRKVKEILESLTKARM